MKKRVGSLALTASMIATLLAGCGNSAAEEEGVSTPKSDNETTGEVVSDGSEDTADEEEDLTDITVSFWSLASVPEEVNLVEDAINEITESDIGVTVHLNIMDVGSYIPQGAMANGVANGEDFDLVLSAAALSGSYPVMKANGMIMPIEDLLPEYAPKLMETVPEEFLKGTTSDGHIYGVPSYCNKKNNMYWMCRTEVLEKADIDIDSIKTIDDLEKALYKIKETCPDMIPISGASFTLNMTYPGYAFATGKGQAWDALGEGTAVAAAVYYDDETLTAVSRYETDDFKADIERIAKWYKDGLVDKDVATDSATANAMMEKPNVASQFDVAQFDNEAIRCNNTNAKSVKLADGRIGTGGLQQFVWFLPVSCDEPEASVKFMNLMYTDERIVNLLNYGIEGKHYEVKEDGTIGFPEGVTAENSGYYMGGLTALIGNGFLAKPWEGADPNTQELAKAEMNNAEYSPLMGFALDTAALGDIYTALCPIANQEYGPALFCGSAPDGYYDEFIQKMKDAGLDEYLDMVNEQIQAWAAENK